MPKYEAFIDGKQRRIEVTRTTQNTFSGKIDDKQHTIEVQTDRLDTGQAFTINVDGKMYKVELPKIEREKPISIKVEEATFNIEVRTASQKRVMTSFEPAPMAPARKSSASKQAAVEGTIAAPMTGRIVRVKVKKGDQVKVNQVLCVIEAMKMENEISTPKAGTVQEVNVSDGSSVSEGDTLFIVS